MRVSVCERRFSEVRSLTMLNGTERSLGSGGCSVGAEPSVCVCVCHRDNLHVGPYRGGGGGNG